MNKHINPNSMTCRPFDSPSGSGDCINFTLRKQRQKWKTWANGQSHGAIVLFSSTYAHKFFFHPQRDPTSGGSWLRHQFVGVQALFDVDIDQGEERRQRKSHGEHHDQAIPQAETSPNLLETYIGVKHLISANPKTQKACIDSF